MADLIDQYLQSKKVSDAKAKVDAKAAIERARQQQQSALIAQQGTQEWWTPANILDKFWMDDFQKGPFSSSPNARFGPDWASVPLGQGTPFLQQAWQQGVGDKVNAGTTSITKAYDTWSQAISYAGAAAPGGIPTVSWDQAGKIANGEVSTGNLLQWAVGNGLGNSVMNYFANATSHGATTALQGLVAVTNPRNPALKPSFDITDDGQRDVAFRSGGVAQAISGFSGATVAWFLDPLVIGGKGVKIFRFGSEALNMRGFTNMQLTDANVSRWAASKLDSVITKMETGEELTKAEKRVAEIGKNISKMRVGTGLENYWVFDTANTTHRADLLGIADNIDDERDALVFVGAIMGDPKYIQMLHVEQTAAADALSRAANRGANERIWMEMPGFLQPAVYNKVLENNINGELLVDDLTRRNEALRQAVGLSEETGGTPLITSFGSRSLRAEKFAGAWAAGKSSRAMNQYARKGKLDAGIYNDADMLTWNGRTPASQEFNIERYIREGRLTAAEAARIRQSQKWFDSTGPSGYEKVFQFSSSTLRPVRVWSWLNGQHASGFMHIRGAAAGNDSLDELKAVVGDSKILRNHPTFLTDAQRIWTEAYATGSPEKRMDAVRQIEQKASEIMADALGADKDTVKRIYDLLTARRADLLETFAKKDGKGRRYGVNPEDQSILMLDPIFQSQLDIKIPMLDMRTLERSVKIAAKDHYKGLKWAESAEMAENLADEVVSLWKAAVLLRMGYTTRNVAEGWMRSWAVLGTIPGMAATGRLIGNTVWSNRGFAARGRAAKKIDARQAEVTNALKENRLRKSELLDELDRHAAEADEQATAYARVEAIRREKEIAKQRSVAKVYNAGLVDDTLTPPVRPFNQARVAADKYARERVKRPSSQTKANTVELPEGAEVSVKATSGFMGGEPTSGIIKISYEGDPSAASLSWNLTTGRIDVVATAEQYRRRGFATALYERATKWAEENGYEPPRHSEDLSDDARGWISGMRGKRVSINPEAIDYREVRADREYARKIGQAYNSLPEVDPRAEGAYKDLVAQVEDQFDYLTNELGVRVEFVDADPYRTSKEMYDDARQGILKVLKTNESSKHPFMTNEQNDKFRAVHDYFGHFGTETGFGQHGEEAAWIAHSQMFTFNARRALTTETRGQNSWFHSYNNVDSPNYPKFAVQKAALLPDEFVRIPKNYGRRVKADDVMDVPEKYTASRRNMAALKDETLAGNATYHARVAQINEDIAALDAKADLLTQRLTNLGEARMKYGKRKTNSTGAFGGSDADVYRDLASNRETVDVTLRSTWAREADAELSARDWVLVQPGDEQYGSELANSVKEMWNDEAAVRVLEGDNTAELAAWMRSQEGAAYRREMNLSRRQVEDRAALVHDMIHNYLPTEQARRLAAGGARDKTAPIPDGDELLAAIGDEKLLQPIHGRAVRDQLDIFSRKTLKQKILRDPINWGFKWLGTIPETVLVRQPFYNKVWQTRVRQLEMVSAEQGKVLDDTLRQAIEKNAHEYALNATNSTLYTIVRYSNPAHLLRFIAPFFPAWENSVRVWLGIVGRDPSVLARANMLWNIPNNMGWVVDKDGNKVESDNWGFLTGSTNQYLVMPSVFADGFKKIADSPLGNVPIFGDAARGASQVGLKSAKGSFNVVTPGQTPWAPGFGPMVTAPVGMVLAGKPDWQDVARKFLGDRAYEMVVPFGEASANPLDAFAPPAAKKAWQLMEGEQSQDYLAVVDAMMQTAMVDWYKSGGDQSTKPDPESVKAMADDFYKFSILASMTLPMSVTRMSKYQPMVDKWNAMKRDPSMTYQQKIESFLTKFGDEWIPLTTSTSRSLAKDLDPTMETFNVLADNKSLAAQLAQLGPETVGILGASAPMGQFDQGVYNYYLTTDMPGLPGDGMKSHVSAAEMQNKIESSAMWREYNAAKKVRDDELIRRGGFSLDAKVNADLKQQWRLFTDELMVQKYGSAWSVGFNDYASNQGKYLEGIVTALKDAKFASSEWGQSPMWQTIRVYMGLREQAQAAVMAGEDASVVNDQWDAVREKLRYTSLEFSDFFDNYLENDKLTIGVSSVVL